MISSCRVKRRCWPAFHSLGPKTRGRLSPLWPKSTASRTSWWRSTMWSCTCTSTGWRSRRRSMACRYLQPASSCAAKHFSWRANQPHLCCVSCSRWVRLLFGREFPLQDLLVVWDALFADSITLDLVDYIFVAMLLYIRDARTFCLLLEKNRIMPCGFDACSFKRTNGRMWFPPSLWVR